MLRYRIAGLTMTVEGNEYDFFKKRMEQYIYTETQPEEVDIKFVYEDCNDIQLPEGNLIANVNQRFWMKTVNGGYASYDYLPEFERNLSLLAADQDWRNISIKMCNIEPFLGIPSDIRSFNVVGEVLRFAILKHKGIIVHASAICYKGRSILFSAPSGTGKSTHTGLWKQFYESDTFIMNDDSPAVRFMDHTPYVFGTPWSGKTEINKNASAPLAAIVFLQQSPVNEIRRLHGAEAIRQLMEGIRKPAIKEMMELTLEMVSQLLQHVPVYLLSCNISKEAVDLVKETIFESH